MIWSDRPAWKIGSKAGACGYCSTRIQGEWIEVPDDTVIKEPNRVGRTIVWPCYVGGRTMIRCFMPGSMT